MRHLDVKYRPAANFQLRPTLYKKNGVVGKAEAPLDRVSRRNKRQVLQQGFYDDPWGTPYIRRDDFLDLMAFGVYIRYLPVRQTAPDSHSLVFWESSLTYCLEDMLPR